MSSDIKIVGLMDENPFHYQTWSGSSFYFFNALKRKNLLYDAISAQPTELSRLLCKLRCFHLDIRKWKFKYSISTSYYAHMTRTALRKLRELDACQYNVILQVGAWYSLPEIKNKIRVSYHDGNLRTLLSSPYGFPSIREIFLKKALTHEKNVYEKMDHIFPMSKWLADSFITDFGIRSSKLTPVGAGVNLPYIRDVKEKCYEEPKLLFVGKAFERKGGKTLLEAFKKVKKEIKDATLTIIGPHLDNCPEGVRCLDYISKYTQEGIDILLNEFASASVFVMPSLYEPFGIVFAEAMAHKLPCVGTNVCAMREIIENGVTGFVVQANDSSALANKLLELLKDPRMCRGMGDKGYARYLQNYTWESVTEKITAVLSEMCS